MKHLLVLGEEKGYRHESVSHAMATIERLGRESGLWTTTIRTDTEVLTKQKLEYNAKNLNDFDAVLFYTGGELEMNPEQKAALLSFVHDDGKGFIGVHSATITFTSWPEYGEMIGGYFDEHPWVTFDAPIIVEDPNFPGMQQWPASFVLKDEIYQMKDYSRDKLRVLTRRSNGQSLKVIISRVNAVTRGWNGYFKHSYHTTFPYLDSWIRMRLRSTLRKRQKRRGRGRGRDHQRWPNAFFAAQGLFSLAQAQAQLRQSSQR